MHLATFRLFKEQGATYEATQVRMFKYGRTETTRTVSPASKKFIEKMGFWPRFDESDDNIRKEKLKLLKDAATSHVNFLKNAAGAKGVDRHMLGLSLLIKDGETSPEIFSDEVYCRAKHWRVSTSNLSHPKFDNWGYGEVVPDGKERTTIKLIFLIFFLYRCRPKLQYKTRFNNIQYYCAKR